MLETKHPTLRPAEPGVQAAVTLAAIGLSVLSVALALYDRSGAIVAVGVFLAVATLVQRGVLHAYPHDRLGLCNLVTAVRAGIAAVLAGAVVSPDTVAAQPWAFVGLAGIAFASDGIDGWLARRAGLVSAFGARFDMETDALFAAILALLVLGTGKAGAEVLVLGFMRYGFVAAALALPWLRAPLPERFRRKAICVVQIAALILLLVPREIGAQWVAIAAAAALVWSFAVDVLWLARRR